MRGSLQQRISPISSVDTLQVSQAKSTIEEPASGKSKVDFKSVLLNSNADVALDRSAKKNGDLSNAASYEDFLENLSEQTRIKRQPRSSLGKDDFLKLFVTQLQNQDPLKPKDGTEMAAQLAQFNGLEQMMNVNKTLERIETADASDRSYRFIDYVGKEITLADGRGRLKDGAISGVAIDLKMPATDATLRVIDQHGSSVAKIPLGSLPEGFHPIQWDGKSETKEALPDGVYTFAVEASGKGGSPIPATIKTRVQVKGIDLKNPNAAFQTDVGKVSINDIVEISLPGQQPAAKENLTPPPILQKNTPQPKIANMSLPLANK